MSAVFSLDQVLACTESATSEYSTTSQCLSALLGRSGRVKFIMDDLRWKKKLTNAPITPIRLLPGDSSPLVVINLLARRDIKLGVPRNTIGLWDLASDLSLFVW